MIRCGNSVSVGRPFRLYYIVASLLFGVGSTGCVVEVSPAWLESNAGRPWALAHIVKQRREDQGARFGAALALTSRHLLVGAPSAGDCGGPIYSPTNCRGGALNAWWRPLMRGTSPVILKPADGGTIGFGTTVSASAGRIWVGAPGGRRPADQAGVVAEHARTGLDWSDPVEITAAGMPAGPGFGQQLALAPPWGAVLAPLRGCPDQPEAVGVLQVMLLTVDEGWILHETVCLDRGEAPPEAAIRGQWGGVAIASERLIVGVPWTKDSTMGRVLVFRLDRNPDVDADPIVFEQELRPEVAAAVRPDGFGVAIAADAERIYVGAPGEGAVYTFKYSQEGRWQREPRLGSDRSDSLFGTAVAVSQLQLLIGAPDDQNCALGVDPQSWPTDCPSSSGAAFLYVLNRDGVWTQRHYITPPMLGSSDFGAAVAIFGSTFAVGAPFERTLSFGVDGDIGPLSGATGAVFVYKRNDDDIAL